MLYVFELMAHASLRVSSSPPIKEPNVRSATLSGTVAVLPCFPQTKWGPQMDRRDWELLDKQMRRLTPPRNDGAIAMMLAAMFLLGMTLGGVLPAHKTEPIQIASMY
jgi:hypothetical protein